LRAPAFPLFLGRRSCPPEGKVLLGVRVGKPLLQALEEEPCLAGGWFREKRAYKPGQPATPARVSADAGADGPGAYFTRDVPLSFDQTHRKYGFRRVLDYDARILPATWKDTEPPVPEPSTHHDPMQELEG